ncbi:MAG: YabP/YqfC family sporulation protein [Clostridia bacterium]|nr:YabP/YqfC family sporulation protein [Clostridia bacterium]
MSFFDSILESLGVDSAPEGQFLKLTLIGNKGGGFCYAYLENVLSVKSYSPQEIAVCVKGGGVTIKGENMYIKKYCQGDLAVCGKIMKAERN